MVSAAKPCQNLFFKVVHRMLWKEIGRMESKKFRMTFREHTATIGLRLMNSHLKCPALKQLQDEKLYCYLSP